MKDTEDTELVLRLFSSVNLLSSLSGTMNVILQQWC